VTYKAKVMFNEYNPGTDQGGSHSSFEQLYVEGKGFDTSPDTNFWIGKRFYGRADVHILDTNFVRMDGVGAGADSITLAGGKLGLAFFSSDSGAGFGDGGTGSSKNPGLRFNADLGDIAVNPGGKLRVTGTYTSGHFDNTTNGKGTNGFGLSLQHNQEITGIGGGNTLWLQYAQGSAGLDGNFGAMTAPSGIKKFRIVESTTWQVGALGGQAVALYGQNDKDDIALTAKFSEVSVGGRACHAVTKNFKLVGEAGYMLKKPDGADTQKLTKFTFAPTLSAGRGFRNRSELRLYVTTARWNDVAKAGAFQRLWRINEFTTVALAPREVGAVENQPPAPLRAEGLRRQLALVQIIGPGAPRALFAADELAHLIEPLAQALGRAGPGDDVLLLSTSRRDASVLSAPTAVTAVTARLFVQGGNLQLVVHDARHDFHDAYRGTHTEPHFTFGSKASAGTAAIQCESASNRLADGLAIPLQALA
jgi:maltoporin